jgi:hypothetical protein
MSSFLQQFLAASVKRRELAIGPGMTVVVREMTAEERAEFTSLSDNLRKSKPTPDQLTDDDVRAAMALQIWIAKTCVIDDAGAQVLADAPDEAVAQAGAGTLDKIMEAVLELSGLKEASQQELIEKN